MKMKNFPQVFVNCLAMMAVIPVDKRCLHSCSMMRTSALTLGSICSFSPDLEGPVEQCPHSTHPRLPLLRVSSPEDVGMTEGDGSALFREGNGLRESD